MAGRGWRVIDADRVKDHLLRDAYEQGFYADLLGIELADGHRVMPRELATLVHTESTVIVDGVTERCLAIGENIVLEGTFSWSGLGRRLLADLAEADYQKLTILFCRSAERDYEGPRSELVVEGPGDCFAGWRRFRGPVHSRVRDRRAL